MRINKSVFRYIEFELYNYQETKRELERYKEEILESTNIPEVNVQTMPGNVTESNKNYIIAICYEGRKDNKSNRQSISNIRRTALENI